MRNNLTKLAFLLMALTCAQSAFADVKIKAKQTMAGQSYENTTYIKGKRQRTESMNGMTISITQCDLRRSIQLNSTTRTYMINAFNQAVENASNAEKASAEKNDGVVRAGGTVTTTVNIKDTGERKQMFGFTARHLIITMETKSSPDACTPVNSKIETDGWYIDAEFVLDCDYGYAGYSGRNAGSGGCRDKYAMKQIGAGKRGYPVYEKMTMFDESGKETYSMVSEVVELSKATLEASLFDIPEGYREVSDSSEMYSTAAMTASMGTNGSTSGSTMKLPNSGTSFGNNTGGVSSDSNASAIGAKKEGTVRIGLANVKTGAVGEGLNAADLASAVRNTLADYLKVPNIEVVPIEAKLPSAIEGEAREKECDFVILANVSHKKGGKGFGGFGSMLGSAVGRVGIGHTGSTAGNIAGQVATQAIVSAGNMSANVKSKDEISLDVKLNKIGGGAALAKVYKAKARSDGEDIISTVIEQAAQAIVDTIGS